MLMIAATLFAASPLPSLPCEAAALHGLGAPATWRFRGPGSYYESEGAKLKWSSATAAVAVSLHGKEKTPLWYVGAVNGGVWRTKDGMDAAKKMKADSVLTEDQMHDLESEVQELTDRFIKEIDAKLSEKEQELMTV